MKAQTFGPPSSIKSLLARLLLLIVSVAYCAQYYLHLKIGFFDDTFIYLNISRNAVENGTWQYYPFNSDRTALLASSPLKISLLSATDFIVSGLLHGDRSVEYAKQLLLLNGIFSWILFLPFWRKHLTKYMLVGILYFYLATVFDSVFEFEGGLLLLWLISIFCIYLDKSINESLAPWIVPLGIFIRPDLSMIVYSALVYLKLSGVNRYKFPLSNVTPWAFYILAWIFVSYLLHVYAIPITYWAKAAIPVAGNEYLLDRLPERLGRELAFKIIQSNHVAHLIGWLTLIGALLIASNKARTSPYLMVVTCSVFVVIAYALPGSFWWYYQNILLLIIGMIFSFSTQIGSGSQSPSLRLTSRAFLCGVLLLTIVGKSPNPGPSGWAFTNDSRAFSYQFISKYSTGRGTYDLPQVGEIILKNPEIGMISYFSGSNGFQWDSAGLAQPLAIPEVQNSVLRLAYPSILRLPVEAELAAIVRTRGIDLPVMEVWAMDDRNFSDARNKCRFVIEEGALCINPLKLISFGNR
jgi:hypothetical protein